MPARSWRCFSRAAQLLLIVATAVALVGCNQLSAKRNLSRLKRILQEIQTHEGDARPYVFQTQAVTDLESNINQIDALIQREDYQGAADQARRTMETAPGLRDQVIQDHAAALRTQAEEDINVARNNEGQRENPELWDVITETQQAMQDANAEQDWEDVIDYGQQIVSDVQTLLQSLRNRALEGLNRAQSEMVAFETLGSRNLVPPLVVESERLVANVQSLIDERSYRLAISTGEQALTKINETVIETKRVLSNQGIARLEELIAEMVEHGVEFRLTERYNTFGDNFDDLLEFYYQNQFDEALAQIRILTPIAQQMVLDTYEAEASELVDLRTREIGELEEAKVREYLPNRIERPIELRDQARERFDEAQQQIGQIMALPDTTFQAASTEDTREQMLLDEVKPTFEASVQLSYEAGDEINNIRRVFRELSESHLADAQAAINVASEVLERFQDIWDPRVDTAIEDADQQFLENRELLRQEIDTTLESARILKATAEFRLNDTPARYNLAIEYSDQARTQAQQVLSDTYTVATRYALVELTWMIDHYEREGAGEYVPEELDRTLRLVQDTRDTLDRGDARAAVARAADARSQLEIMIQSLRRVANEDVEQLRELTRSTSDVLDEINAEERLALIQEHLQQAETLARQDQLKDAIETAQRGQRLAEQTTTEARLEWAQTELDDAQSRIAAAQAAGAATYAATTVQEARDLADTAQRRITDGDYQAAQLAAAEASLRADEARLALISEAEEAIVRAGDYEAWRFNYQALADAQVARSRAQRALETGQYGQAQELAQFATNRAAEITSLAQQSLYFERVEGLRQTIEHAMATGASLFQPNELESVLDDLTQIQATYAPANHDDFERQLEALEARMATIIEGTPEVIEAALNEYRDWIRRLRDEKQADLYAQRDLEEVAREILGAQQAFDTGHFRESYRSVMRAGQGLTRVQVMADEFDYKAAAEDILERLEEARRSFSAYISISPRMLTYMAIGPGGSGRSTNLVSEYSPSDFREEVERLQIEANDLAVPATRREHHETLLACLRNAQLAARNFEYLHIADRMDEHTIGETVSSAYDFLETSRRQSTDLTAGLLEGPLAGPITNIEMGRPFVERALANEAFGHYYSDTARTR